MYLQLTSLMEVVRPTKWVSWMGLCDLNTASQAILAAVTDPSAPDEELVSEDQVPKFRLSYETEHDIVTEPVGYEGWRILPVQTPDEPAFAVTLRLYGMLEPPHRWASHVEVLFDRERNPVELRYYKRYDEHGYLMLAPLQRWSHRSNAGPTILIHEIDMAGETLTYGDPLDSEELRGQMSVAELMRYYHPH